MVGHSKKNFRFLFLSGDPNILILVSSVSGTCMLIYRLIDAFIDMPRRERNREKERERERHTQCFASNLDKVNGKHTKFSMQLGTKDYALFSLVQSVLFVRTCAES